MPKPIPDSIVEAEAERAKGKKEFHDLCVELTHTKERAEEVLTRLRSKVASKTAAKLRIVSSK